jgi:hypothetical protein
VSYRDQLIAAEFHAKGTRAHLVKALTLLGCDFDGDDDAEPVEESGLAPLPPDGDYSAPDHVEPTAPLDPDLVNPQSRGRGRFMRLVS